MGGAWAARDVRVVLPVALALAMLERAERHGAGRPRTRRLGASVVLHRAGAAVGEAHLAWCAPSAGEATLWRVAWDPARGGSEDLVWAALEALAGRPLRPA